jgi:plastocyanin domain-containing protein
MKIKKTQTTTQEINISLPAFTKVAGTFEKKYFAVIDENTVFKIFTYNSITGIIDIGRDVNTAFQDGFEFIEESEFNSALIKVTQEFDDTAKKMQDALETIHHIDLMDKEREDLVEYQDQDRAEREEYLSQFEEDDY